MNHKYKYMGLQGAMKAQWMLAMFPELKLKVEINGILLTIERISIWLMKTSGQVSFFNAMDSENTNYSAIFQYNMDRFNNIEIIVPLEMESFFDAQLGDIVLYRSLFDGVCYGKLHMDKSDGIEDIWIGSNYFEDTLDEIVRSRRIDILERNGVEFHMPELVNA